MSLRLMSFGEVVGFWSIDSSVALAGFGELL